LAHPRDTLKRALALTAAVVLIRLPTLWEPRWYSDEGTFTTVAWVHSLGVPLYSGVFDINPPGIYWLYGALLGAGADQHHLVVQAALLIGVLVSVLCIFAIASTWFGMNVGLGAGLLAAAGLSLPTLDGDLLNIEIAALPFFLAALLLALQKNNRFAFIAGALAACALLIRSSYLLDSVAILIVLWPALARWRRLALALLGGAAVIGLAAVALAVTNSLQPYVNLVLPVQRAYVVFANGGSLFPLLLRLLIAALIAIAWFWPIRHASWRALAAWLPASAAAASITPRELSHYSIEVIPPLAIAITLLIAVALRRLPFDSLTLRFASALAAIPLALALLVGGAEATLIFPAREVALMRGTAPPPAFLHNFSYAGLAAYYARWAGWAARHPLETQDLDGFPGPFPQEDAEAQLLDRLAGGSNPKIQLLGDRSWVYFLARLRPATPFIAMNSAYRLVPEGDSRVRASLSAREADLVAVADVPTSQWLPIVQSSGYEQVASSPWPTYRHTPTGA
jgi:hypothetical protein